MTIEQKYVLILKRMKNFYESTAQHFLLMHDKGSISVSGLYV